MTTMTAVKDVISRFRKTRHDIQLQTKQIKRELIQEEKNLSNLSDSNIAKEDHVNHHAKFIREQEQGLRVNIQNYLKGSKTYNESPASKTVRSLDVYLRRFGQRSEGREIYIPYVLVIRGSWKRLREIVEEELAKLPKNTWGIYQQQMRAKKSNACREKIKELKKVLSELKEDN